MPELESPTYLIPLTVMGIAVLVMLVLLLFLVFRIWWRLGWIERKLEQQGAPSQEQAPTVAETSPGGAFEAFLEEEPSRRQLTKSEQFSAYRRWRHEKGMNWSNT